MTYFYYVENDLDQGFWSATPGQTLEQVIADIEAIYGKVSVIEEAAENDLRFC
jgi:hypothetical protein